MKSSGGTSRIRPFLSCNCASARASALVTGPRDELCWAAKLEPGVAYDESGSLSTHSMCHSESRRHATRFGNSLAGNGRPSLNSSSSPVSKNVPYASAKTPRDVTHASFIDRVVPRCSREPSKPGRSPASIAAPPTTGHARRACILPSTVHAALTKPPNASDRITSPRSDARSLEDAATTNAETVRSPISAARAGSSGSPAKPKAGAVAAVEPKAGTPPELPKAGAG